MSIWDFDKWAIKTEKLHRKTKTRSLSRASRCFTFIWYCRLSRGSPNYSLHIDILVIQTINLPLKQEFLHEAHCLCNVLSQCNSTLAARVNLLLNELGVHSLFQCKKEGKNQFSPHHFRMRLNLLNYNQGETKIF